MMQLTFTAAPNPIKLSRYTWQGCSPWFSRETMQAVVHIASGVNAPGEVSGLADNGFNIGITCGEIRDGLLRTLKSYASRCNQLLFVDSGAFSEVEFSVELGRLVVVRPITEQGWVERFRLYRWAAAAYGRRARVVAPDVVGDQAATLARLEKYAHEMRRVAELGAMVIIPVQKGALPMSAMFARCVEILGIPAEQVIAGVPMKKDATSLEDLAELARSLPVGARVHLLGLGPESKRFAAAIATVRGACPTVRITSDSVTLRRLVGRTNGRGGSARPITRYQDDARAMKFGPQAIKDYAISRWRRDLRSIEDAFEARAAAYVHGIA